MREMWFTFENCTSIMGGMKYTCSMKELCSPCDWDNISYESYYHKSGYKDADVKSVVIIGESCKKIPEKLIEFFPNMESLEIRDTDITELDKETMNKFKQLKRFASFGNKISFLYGDLFAEFNNLECLQVESSALLLVDPIIIDQMKNLKHIEFKGNAKFDLCFTNYKFCFTPLEKIRQQLIDQFSKFSYVKSLQESVNVVSAVEEEQIKEEVAETEKEVEEDLTPYIGLFTDIKKVLENENSKDLTIFVGNKKFRAHKFVMAIRSPFMAKLFEARPISTSELKFDDIPAATFDIIIKYIYSSQLPDEYNFLSLFAAASKLQIPVLKSYAEEDILNNINSNNAIEVFELGHKNGNGGLKGKAYEEIKKKYQMLDFKDEWMADSDGLMKILEGFKKQEEELRKFREKFEKMLHEEQEEY